MPKLDMASRENSLLLLGKPMPKFVSPTVHPGADSISAASFLVAAAFARNKNKRAALASLHGGAGKTAISTLTDYPGSVKKLISFSLHAKLDFGLDGMVAAMAQFVASEDAGAKGSFRMQSAMMGGLDAATGVEPQQISGEKERRAV